MTNSFRFKQFTIQQNKAAMKVGTDSVLLGAWANLTEASQILDIGTGTGLLAIMAAQRNKDACIDTVEIDPLSCEEASFNIDACPWKDRLTLYPVSIFDFMPAIKYEHIISNPPFFTASISSSNLRRTTARHCENFFHVNLIKKVRSLLTDDGKFSLILPVEEATRLLDHIHIYDFYLSRLCRVFPNSQHPAKRFLIELSTISVPLQEENLTIEYERHCYTEEYVRLTKDFYLMF